MVPFSDSDPIRGTANAGPTSSDPGSRRDPDREHCDNGQYESELTISPPLRVDSF